MRAEEISTYEEAVEYLYQIPKFTGKSTQEDTKRFYDSLFGTKSKANIIHIAGTNGKGSVCAYLRSVLMESGYRVAMFTSPHLVDIRERFTINGEMVSKETFLTAFQQIAVRIKEYHHPSFFEYVFLMAMMIFDEAEVDFILLETGLGGRLDSTNVIEDVLVSGITSIGMDHMEYLGDTLEQIAGEKAGIIKQNSVVVYSRKEEKVSNVIEQAATEKGTEAVGVSNSDYTLIKINDKSIDFSCQSRYYGYVRFLLHTIALYQMENATLAVRIIDCVKEKAQGEKISRETLISGIEKAFWPGRMEEIEENIFVDGAHNVDGLRAFLESAAKVSCKGKKILVFGAVADKEFEKMFSMIEESEIFTTIFLTQIENSRTVNKEEFMRIVADRELGENISVYSNSRDAYSEAKRLKETEDIVYVAGSLYLVGEIKALSGGNQND